jgi:two-component sensor histidine kinase/CheY-like chemotaxis protein
MRVKTKRPKISILHDEIPKHVQELMHLTRLAEMGRLSASVAHEINTPLMVAQGFAENIELLLDKDAIPREEIRVQILEIIKSCQRMSRIINKMNRMSRNQKLRLHIVDVAEVALNAVDFLKVQLAEFDVQLEFDFDRPLPIKCDAVQIEQIILNILSNALHALEQNPSDRRIRISFQEVGDWQCIRVWNNGPIIPQEVQTQLMTPFFTTKDEAQGTGLGLAVSKAIMQVHEGDLTCASNEKEGTEFVLSFPRPAENPWKQAERSRAGAIVLIDRQQNYRKTLHEKFRLLGFQVQAFQDYKEGIQAAIQQKVVGVFIDVIPGMPESVAYVKKLRQELGPTALIFTMSNYPSARDMKYDLKAGGATDCFEKPIHADNFVYILRLLDAALEAEKVPLKNAA